MLNVVEDLVTAAIENGIYVDVLMVQDVIVGVLVAVVNEVEVLVVVGGTCCRCCCA